MKSANAETAMFLINHETIDIIRGNPAANNAIIAIAFICNIAAFFAPRRSSKRLLAASCITALLMPIYDFASAYIQTIRSGGHIEEPFAVMYIMLGFSPTSIILAFVLIFIGVINNVRVWSIVVALSIISSWLGIAALNYL